MQNDLDDPVVAEAPTEPGPPPPIHQAMANVMRAVGAVGKGGRNENQGYQFRGIDQFMNALHPAMAAEGVLALPQVIDRDVKIRDRANGVTTHVWLRVRYLFVGPAGDTLEAIVDGEAADTFDKATNKALAAALKYAVLQTFMIPTEDQRDGDADSPDMGATADLTARLEAERQLAAKDADTANRLEWYRLVAGLDEAIKRDLRTWCELTETPAHPGKQDPDQFAAFRNTVTTLLHGRPLDLPTIPDEPEFDVDGPGADGPADRPVVDTDGLPHRRQTPAERAAARATEATP